MQLLDEAPGPLRIVDGLVDLGHLEGLDRYAEQVLAVVAARLGDGSDPLELTGLVARCTDALTSRLLSLAETALGAPPGPYAWLALGSHGRGEQVLSSDQDHAIAYADGLTDQHYFPRLAEQVVRGLERAGIPRCSGGFMATRWARPIGELHALFSRWVDAPEPEALLRAEVFLDVRPVHGELAVDALDRTLVAGGGRGPFRAQLAAAAVAFRPPLTVFGRVRADDGAVDVKAAGTAPIVLLARLYALVAGSDARSTQGRLEAAVDGSALSRAGAAELLDAYRFLTGLRLRAQVAAARTGRPVRDLVRLDDLTPADRARLRDALRHVRDTQSATASRFATHTVT